MPKKANHAIKYRLYPNKEQEEFFAKSFGCCRKIWNLMLADRKESYEKTGSFGSQNPAFYKKEHPYLKEVDSLALTNVWKNQEEAFSRFKKGISGFPNFKAKHRCRDSYTTNNQNGTVAMKENGIRLPKIGVVKAKFHRFPSKEMVIKSATVSRDRAGQYFCSLLFEYMAGDVPARKVSSVEDAVGLDFSIRHMYVDDRGCIPDFSDQPDMEQTRRKIEKAQRKLSHRIQTHVTGYQAGRPVYDKKLSECRNVEKQRRKVAKLHKKLADQREDFQHKSSDQITNDYGLICLEDISVKDLQLKKGQEPSAKKRRAVNRKLMDRAWYRFTVMLGYKAARKGGRVIKVPKDYASSQICHCCGEKDPEVKDIRVRKWKCPACGAEHDRDVNAAINIRNKGWEMAL